MNWQPGDTATIACTRSIRTGRRVTLVSRHIGRIIGAGKLPSEGRPWWVVRLIGEASGVEVLTSEFEDSLEGATTG